MNDHRPGAGDLPALRSAAEDLSRRYAGVFDPQLVERYVFESYTALARSTHQGEGLVATAARFAADRLQALARATEQTTGPGQETVAGSVPLVLFVCPYNIGRSQIAAALLSHYAGGTVEARSAGPEPGERVDPLVVAALREAGVPLEGAYPKPVTDDVVRAADYVVTIGAVNIALLYPGKEHLEWDIPDPGDASLEQVQALVAELDTRVRDLWAGILD